MKAQTKPKLLDTTIFASAEYGGLVTVDLAAIEEKHVKVRQPVWKLNDSRPRLLWLQRAAFWLLKKLGCYQFEMVDHMTMNRISYRPESVLELIYGQMEAADFTYCRKPSMILMGRRTYMRLLRETGQNTAAERLDTVADELPPYLGRYRFRGEWFSLKLYDVPWIDGCVVL